MSYYDENNKIARDYWHECIIAATKNKRVAVERGKMNPCIWPELTKELLDLKAILETISQRSLKQKSKSMR
jgi:hypothetical protein